MCRVPGTSSPAYTEGQLYTKVCSSQCHCIFADAQRKVWNNVLSKIRVKTSIFHIMHFHILWKNEYVLVFGLFQKASTFKMRMKGEEPGQVSSGRIIISGMGGERRQMLECGLGTNSS